MTTIDSTYDNGMGCVLRVYGDDLEVDRLLSELTISPCHVSRKGEPRFGPKSKAAVNSGFHVVTSEASESDLDRQVSDTIDFMNQSSRDLETIAEFSGVTHAYLDFAVESRIGEGVFVQNQFLPRELVNLAGKFGLGINLSLYPPRSSNR